MPGPGYVHTPAPGYAPPAYRPGAGFFPGQQMDSGEAFGRRLTAKFIDGMIMSVIHCVLSVGVIFMMVRASRPGESSDALSAPMLSLYFGLAVLVSIGYDAGMLAAKGQTLGKLALGIRVIGPDGKNPGFFRAAVRETFGNFISWIACFLGFLWMLWDPQQQTWHDKICGTTVVRA